MKRDLVVLVNLPPGEGYSYKERGCVWPGAGMLLVGTEVKKAGWRVKVVDGGWDRGYVDRVREILSKESEKVAYVGMGVMTTQIKEGLKVSKVVKGWKGVRVVWGGIHPTLYPEQTIKSEMVDVVVVGEGGKVGVRLVEEEGLRGVVEGEMEEIETLPHFDFSIVEVERYLEAESVYGREFPTSREKIKVMPILSGLGCPYKCQFCINAILKRKYRRRSAESIVEEIKRLQRGWGANTFLFLDEDFFVDMQRGREFLKRVEEEGLHFNMRFWSRVDHFKSGGVDERFLRRLQGVGRVSMVMGGESGNTETLKMLGKGIVPWQITESLRIITKSGEGVFPRYSFMVGLEGEGMREIRNTYRFCLRLKNINPKVDIAGPFLFRLYPGSPIFDRMVERWGMVVPETLEGWGESVDEMVWTPKEFRKRKEVVGFYGECALAWVGKERGMVRWGVKKVLGWVGRFRVKRWWWGMPVEWWVVRWVRGRRRER